MSSPLLPDALDAGADLNALSLAQLPAIPRPRSVVLTAPDHFEVAYVINPHMAGHVGTVDRDRARAQWEALRTAYAELGLDGGGRGRESLVGRGGGQHDEIDLADVYAGVLKRIFCGG